MKNEKRVCIYPKDVMLLTGKTERHGRMLLDKIKASLQKENHQDITVKEFCTYTGIDIADVTAVI